MVSLFMAAAVAASAPADPLPVAPPPRAVAIETVRFRLRNVAAVDAAKAVGEYFEAAGRVVVTSADARTNFLVVRASAAAVERVRELVAALDRTPTQFALPVTILQVPASFLADCRLTKPGEAGAGCWELTEREAVLFNLALRNTPGAEVLSRPQLCVADGQTGFLQVGAEDGHGPGVSARLTPRLTPDGANVLLRLDTARSLPTRAPVVRQAGAVAAFAFTVESMQTTVRVRTGGTVVIAQPFTGDDGKPAATLYVVGAQVVGK